jgi:hypothetical protein
VTKRPSLAGIDMGPKAVEREPAAPPTRNPASTQPRDDVPEAETRAGYKVRTRIEKPHVSLYANPETFDAFKRLALDNRTTAQALFRRGLLLVLQEHGLYLDKTEADV